MAMERHFIQEGVIRSEIESFLRNELNRAGYSSINIQKTPLATRIILYVEKPPIVIGKKGRRINTLTTILTERYGVDNPVIDVQKIEKPTLDPNIIARRIAVALERGMNRRRIAYKAIRAVIGSGARGVEIVLSGKLVGKGGRSRSEKYLEGYMKKAGDSLKLVKIGSTQAYLKAGVIGVTVKIVPPGTKFPDQISINPLMSKVEAEPEVEDEKTKKKRKTAKKTVKKKKAGKEDKTPKPKEAGKTVKTGEKPVEPAEGGVEADAEVVKPSETPAEPEEEASGEEKA
ncbi:MAG: 30S ribosomal protein S3 [Candidatus Altiarchaeota archaeon]